MINRDPRCVFVSSTLGEAEMVVTWLGAEAIGAQVMDVNTLGGLDGLTPWSKTGVGQRGVEVWVKSEDDVERAAALVAEHQAEIAAKASARKEELGPVDVVCDECGKTTPFPAGQRGSVQNCKACGAHVDVPGDDEDWSDAEAAEDAET